jgi:hypothetical protein
MTTITKRSQSSYINFGNKAPVNNADLDPIQGFDADVFVVDQATGNLTLLGRFVSIQITVQNDLKPYVELNQRVPRYLDGLLRIGFVLERGMLDARVLAQTFGYTALTREQRVNRMPRFQITFSSGAPDLNESSGRGVDVYQNGDGSRNTNGDMVLTYCAVNTFQMGAQAGGEIIANRWEGMAEGIEVKQRNVTIDTGVNLGNAVDADQALTYSQQNYTPFPWDGLFDSGPGIL